MEPEGLVDAPFDPLSRSTEHRREHLPRERPRLLKRGARPGAPERGTGSDRVRSSEEAYYAPLAALRLPEGCDPYLGVIHHDDRDGDRRRIAAAARTVSDFGIATECGWGRGDPSRAPGLLDSHRIALEGQ